MTLRWGIVTSGKISHDFVNAFNSYPDVGDQVIAAVAARDKSRAEEFGKIHKIGKVFDSYDDMATSNDIDVAYIGALNPDHYRLAKLFLESGKHGKLGDVQFVEVNFGILIANVDRLRKKDLGGSAILDIGIYALQFAQFVFKEEPIKVTAVGELNDEGVDAVDTVVLEYSGGRRAVLNIHSKVKLWNKATVYGSSGRATVEDPFNFPNTLIHVDGKVEEFPLHTSSLSYNFTNSAGLVYEAVEVACCIRKGVIESSRMTHQESLVLAKLMDTVRTQVGVHFDVDDKEY
ncbi:unnamed protein product, partial [Brenthis ino]